MSEEKTGNQNTPDDQERGLRYVLYDGMMFQAMVSLSGGAFIIAFALLLGASNSLIGLLGSSSLFREYFWNSCCARSGEGEKTKTHFRFSLSHFSSLATSLCPHTLVLSNIWSSSSAYRYFFLGSYCCFL